MSYNPIGRKFIEQSFVNIDAATNSVTESLDVSENKDSPQAFINPSFEIIEEELVEYDEGCLSVPGFYETVARPSRVKVSSQDIHGKKFEIEAEGMLSTCVQHEIDHLDGKLFVDYLSPLKRQRIRLKLEKEHKKSA